MAGIDNGSFMFHELQLYLDMSWMYLQKSKQDSKPPIHPVLAKNRPLNKDDSKPPIHPVWMEKDPQPVPPPVYKEPHDKDDSKPSVDEDQMEKELLDLLQRKFADD